MNQEMRHAVSFWLSPISLLAEKMKVINLRFSHDQLRWHGGIHNGPVFPA
jgi:hypothetical protein